ncbi:MAG: PEGA domain-containing protein [Thermoanaerobaculia bacterium]
MKRALLLATGAATIFLASAPLSAQKSSDAPSIVRVQHRGHRGTRGFRGGRRVIVRPSFYWGWGWGYPYYYGAPYYYGGYHRRPYGGYPSPEWAAIDTDVSPESARVFLDGTYVGTADDFDGHPDFLYLKRGRYRIEFRLPGYEDRRIEIQARPGMKLRLDDDLRKIPGAKQYGSYDDPEGAGEIRRFWAKRRDVAESVDDEEDDGEDELEVREDELAAPDRPGERRDSDRWRESTPETGSEAARDTARLRVRVEPPDAVVFLDDRFIGTAGEIGTLSRGVSVSPGRHTVTVSRPGYKDRTVEVEVDEDETEEIEITLAR